MRLPAKNGPVSAGRLSSEAAPGGRLDAAQQRLASACAEADRLRAAADQEQARLREARRARASFERDSEQGLALADPRRLAEAKHAALVAYHGEVRRASDRPTMLAGTAIYLRELTRLNRAARRVAGQNQTWNDRVRQLEDEINRLHAAAEAARVAADAARDACLEARRALVQDEEAMAAGGSADDEAPLAPWDEQPTLIEALLEADRDRFGVLVAGLAEEVGLDASRLQLLLLELRQALWEHARAGAFLDFAPDNRFWAQFSRSEARAVAGALGVLNRGFDGRGGWQGGRPAEPREIAIAVSLASMEPRLLRVRPTRADLEKLWHGTTVNPLELVRERSPDLALETFEPLAGEKAADLAELWNSWGRLRRLMLSPA